MLGQQDREVVISVQGQGVGAEPIAAGAAAVVLMAREKAQALAHPTLIGRG